MPRPNIRIALACLLLGPVSVLAQAPTGIALENAAFNGEHASGTCGPAKIEITGVDADNTYDTRRLIRDYGASVRIQSQGRSLVIGDGGDGSIPLQNQNKVHCVSTPSGPRLVLAAYCFSNYCLPISYAVIDPTTLRVLSRGTDGECDAACAEKALGASLSADLRRTEL